MAKNITYTDWFNAVAEIMKEITIKISCFFIETTNNKYYILLLIPQYLLLLTQSNYFSYQDCFYCNKNIKCNLQCDFCNPGFFIISGPSNTFQVLSKNINSRISTYSITNQRRTLPNPYLVTKR